MNQKPFPDKDQEATNLRIAELLQESHNTNTFPLERKEELNVLLRSSEENRAFAAQFILDSESLKELLTTEEISALTSGHSPKRTSRLETVPFIKRIFPLLAYAAVVALSGSLIFTWLNKAPIALIQDEANAIFAEGTSPRDGKLESKSYYLISGMIAVEFRNGVSMTVKAPAEFEVVNEFRVRLNHGNIRAFAPVSGHGFIIETSDVDIQDLGTEFGVSVDRDSGDSEVHVFDGQVNVNKLRDKETIASLEFGESVTIRNGKVNPSETPAQGTYLTPADVSYSRWVQLSNEFRNDEDALFYYSFTPEDETHHLLKDESKQGERLDGTIEGARWVSGRWPGKRALLFDKQTDAVEINIPGELTQFTFGAWVNLDRLDEPVTSILNSMDYKEGSLHLQISRSLGSFVPAVYPRIRKNRSEAQLPTGNWVLLTAVIDTEKNIGRTWINGQRDINGTFSESTFIRPGNCLLGGYRTELDGERTKGFRGRIDEVFLLKRALTQSEIRRIYNHGRPDPGTSNDV